MAYPTDVDMASIGRTVLVDPTTGLPLNTAAGIPSDPLPAGATSLSTGTIAAATAMAAVLAAAAGKTTYISGFQVTGMGASTAVAVLATVTGVLGGTLPYYVGVPVNTVLSAVTPLVVAFAPPIPASAASLNIQVNVGSFGSGNTNAAVVAQGYRR